jgi:hypothetical protein
MLDKGSFSMKSQTSISLLGGGVEVEEVLQFDHYNHCVIKVKERQLHTGQLCNLGSYISKYGIY